MKVAVVGSGISGASAAAALAGHAQVTLFEADHRLGGHSHTVDVTLPAADGTPVTHGVDTGFLVFNPRTYPRLVALFNQLDVPVAAYHLCDTGKVSVINPVGIDFGAAYMVPFTPERLKALYPTPKAYVDKVGARLNQLVKQGWYLPEDAAEVRAAAVEFAKKL